MAELIPVPVQVPTHMDNASPAVNLPEDGARLLRNFLIHHPGVIFTRGPIYQLGDPDCGSNTIPTGIWSFDGTLLVGRATASATAKVMPWQAPWSKPTAANQLANPDTTMKHITTLQAAPTVTNVSAAASGNNVIGGRGVRLGQFVYGYSFGVDQAGNPAVNEQGGFLYRRRLLRWDGTTTAPTVYVNAPEGAQDVAAHLNRLWVAGGRDVPGGAPGVIEFNALYYSDQDGPTADTTAMWKDDASGLVNKIIVGANDPNDYLIGLAHQGDNLVIFKRRSTYLLTGYSAATFNVRRISSEFGCIDPASIVEHNDKVYFASLNGFCRYDGTTIQLISRPIERALDAVLATVNSRTAGIGPRRWWGTAVSAEYVLMGFGNQAADTGVPEPDGWAGLYCTVTGGWVEFKSDSTLDDDCPAVLAGQSGSGYPYIFDCKRTLDVEFVARSTAIAPADADTVNSVTNDIQAEWLSRLYKLVKPGYRAQLHRISIDYYFLDDGGQADAACFRVSLRDATSNTIVSDYNLPAIGISPTYSDGHRRHVQDAFGEAHYGQLRVHTNGQISGPDAPAALFGATIEVQRTRQTRSN